MKSAHPILPKKSFGQHFLVQRGAVDLIVRSVLASPAERILEIGPGAGVLTEPLLAGGRPFWAVELDTEACVHVMERFGPLPHFHLIQGDAVHAELPPGPPWAVVGNLPYNAATAILTRLLLEDIPWERMVLMFQLEVGRKLMGTPGEKSYGPLSLLTQQCARFTRLMDLGPGAFSPRPKVDSVVLCFQPREDALPIERRKPMLDLLHRSFAHRRKTLANNWQGWIAQDRIEATLAKLGLSPRIRAEAIDPVAWVRILDLINPWDAPLP
jgi:16S rRNA (adenine1518-N6/adenine1519-N6)-dimethyltransferase